MQSEPADRRRQTGRGRRGEGRQSRAEQRGSSEEEIARLKDKIATMQQRERGRRADREEEEEEEERGGGGRSVGDGGKKRESRGRRAASEGGDRGEQSGRLRWRVNQLEKEKLELMSGHNQELCRLQAELTRLRSSVERGEAQRVELQYQLTASQRDADRATELSRDKHALTERAAELQHRVEELQRALDITRRAREEDQHALQQEVEERDRLIQSFSSENQQLHRLLQDQEEALEKSERRMMEVEKEREKEAEVNRRQADELKYLTERDERSRREKEALDQRVRTLESSIEAERSAHLESKFSCEIIQLRVRDMEAALAAERCGQQEAMSSLELLRAQFREVETAYSLERERRSSTEHVQEQLQKELEQCKSDLSVALEMERKTSRDLTERLEEEKRQHTDTHTQLEQAAQRCSDAEETFRKCLTHIRETLHQHANTGPPPKDDGKWSTSADVLQLLQTTLSSIQHRQEMTDKQLQDLLVASEHLQQEKESLQQLTSDQRRQLEGAQQEASRLQAEVARLHQESSDWSTQSRGLQAELEREREQMTAGVQQVTERYQDESEARLSFLYSVYQRLLAGCVLLDQPEGMLGNFTWQELCDVINEQVDQLTSDLRRANDKIGQLQSVCEKKSVCVLELQRSQECVLSRLEECVRRREEAWSSQHTHTVTQLQNELQVCRSECDSLQLRASSLTSDLARLQGLLRWSHRESASFLSACALLAGALTHTHRRLHALSQQKTFLSRRLADREAMEEEVRRLVGALEGEDAEEEEVEAGRRRRAVRRRWRRSVHAVLAVRRWRALAEQTTVLFQVEVGGGRPAVCVCAGFTTATHKVKRSGDEDDGGRGGVCARWLHSKRLSSTILSSVAHLQEALTHTGSSPPDVMSASRSALSRLLDRLLDQSDSNMDDDALSGRLSRLMTLQPDRKVLVSTLQQHFLLFSQRLHSAEVERRSLRLEVANLKRGLRQEREETCRTVPAERFQSVCAELRQALSREQEAQTLVQEQTNQLHTLQLRVSAHAGEQNDARCTLSQTAQSLSEARQEVGRKERSLRILGKHLSGVQKERKQLEERLRRVEDELRDAARRRDCLIHNMKAAETSYKEVTECLVQSRGFLSVQPRPLPLPREHLQLSRTESIMGAPEVAACQSLLSTVSQLCRACSSRIDWLEQEVSAHRSHVTALRSELQDACLRDNLAFVPADSGTRQPLPLSDLPKQLPVSLSPAPSSPVSKPRPRTKTKAVKKNRQMKRKADRQEVGGGGVPPLPAAMTTCSTNVAL